MDVWLVDPKGQIIPHTSDSVKDNTISATVSIKCGAVSNKISLINYGIVYMRQMPR